jgi:hypothetical protein
VFNISSRWRTILSCVLAVIAIITMIPVAILVVGLAIPVRASAAANDIIFARAADAANPNPYLVRVDQSGFERPVSGTNISQTMPDISPDASKLVYVGQTEDGSSTVATINSDGSGAVKVLTRGGLDALYQPRWSPDGQWIAYIVVTHVDIAVGNFDLMKVKSDGSGSPIKIISAMGPQGGLSWSPDSRRIAFSSEIGNPVNSSQLHLDIIDADGTNYHQAKANDGWHYFREINPVWSPSGSTIYLEVAWDQISAFTSTTNFAVADGIDDPTTHGSANGMNPRLSNDGRYLLYVRPDDRVYSSPTTRGSNPEPPTVHSGSDERALFPVFASPVQEPPSAVTVGAPSLHDPLLTRAITVNLDKTGVAVYQYGWSQSSRTPPSTPYQSDIKVRTGQGRLDFRATTPDQDWYLWIRAVMRNQTISAWLPPLRVHTPRSPLWVGLGDSYSSGHHQSSDAPFCPLLGDVWSDLIGVGLALGCNNGRGPADLEPDSLSFSWISRAVAKVNAQANIPQAWSLTADILASSGASTTTIAGRQESQMRQDLAQRADSWNLVSVTGGADDADFSTTLARFYSRHWTSLLAPWSVDKPGDCPDTQSVYANAQAAEATIRKNLSSIVAQAVAASPSIQILNLGYPYVVDKGNPCFADHKKAAGVKSLIDLLNADHKALIGPNVRYVNLAGNSGFGLTPISSGYLQKTRLYGYPHPSDSGQDLIASLAASLARNIS